MAALMVLLWAFVLLMRRDVYRAIAAGMKTLTDTQRRAIEAECQKRHDEYDLYRAEVQALVGELRMLIHTLQETQHDPTGMLEAPLARFDEVEEQLLRR
jgi:hypothetical protein